MSIIDSIQLSGVTYQIQGSGGGGVPESTFTAYTATTDERISQDEEVAAAGLNALNDKITPTVELTQAEYDALVTAGTVSADTYYIITDAQAGDLTNYYTKTETNTLLGGKQATLVSGTNIKTINNESILGSGNIDIQGGGGGKAIEAGRGISITTGETADTVSFNLPISTGRSDSLIFNIIDGGSKNVAYGQNASAFGLGCNAGGYASFVIGGSNTASTSYAFAGGDTSKANGNTSFAFGHFGQANGDYSVTLGGLSLRTNNQSEHASGQYNNSVRGSSTFGDSGNTLFSVGNGTGDNARHNAFEIRQNGDIYLSSGGTDIKLQDHLGGGGGGGSSYTAGRGIDITNDTISFSLPISAGTGANSIIEGSNSNIASGQSSHAEGKGTTASSYSSHAEGYNTRTNGNFSHAEGRSTTASGQSSHAEGYNTTANGDFSHAEGGYTTANGAQSHAEGASSNASGQQSHAEGYNTTANGQYSHAEGNKTTANNRSEHASGQYNVSSSASTTFGDSGNTLFSVGNGTAVDARHNAFEIRQNGDIYLTKDGQDVKLQDQLGGGSITVDSALSSTSENPVQNKALYDELRIIEPTETVLRWAQSDGGSSSNYPSGCTKVVITIDEQQMTDGYYTLYNDNYDCFGKFNIESNGGDITVSTRDCESEPTTSITYSISGNVVTVEYPTITNVTKIGTDYDNYWTWKAIVNNATPLIDQVIENEEVTAAALNTLNDKIGDIETLLSQI